MPLAPVSLRSALPTLAVVALLAAIYWLVPGVQAELATAWDLIVARDTEGLSRWFRSFGVWGPLVIIAFMVAQMFLIVFPSWLPVAVAVIGYGPWWGALIGLVGVVAASLVGFYLGRWMGRERLESWIGEERDNRLRAIITHYGFGAVALFRVSPFLSTDAVSFVAGIGGMRLRRYLLATLLGYLPLTAVIAYFGRDIAGLKEGMWWLGGLGVITYLAWAVWRRRRRRRGTSTDPAADTEEHHGYPEHVSSELPT